MDEIRKLDWDELPRFVEIASGAYPLMIPHQGETLDGFAAELRARMEADPRMSLHGMFRDSEMLGGMIYYDFRMNLFGTPVTVGGLGLVSVDITSRRQHAAREMVLAFLRHYDEYGAPLAALYPFRPDFYRRMGFGFGTPVYEHVLPPASLPASEMRKFVRLASAAESPQIAACYWGAFTSTHGLFEKSEADFRRPIEKGRSRVAVFEGPGGIQGYMAFSIEKAPGENPMAQDVSVTELVWNSREALEGLLGFLCSLSDQVRFVRLRIQDEEFVNLLLDPRDCSHRVFPPVAHQTAAQGIGIMYRILDLKWFFELAAGHSFGRESFTLTIDLKDDFLPGKTGSTVVRFEEGMAKVQARARPGLRLTIGIDCLTSMLLGCARMRTLYDYGLAEVSDKSAVPLLDEAFRVPRRPICWTAF